ncbi:unnamed protein product [Linum tenue]|uniref:Uncharacterized protein n=1 Tax=Linum tenue TaxID=586396 RepID=A0AAV0RPG5_9ROSI|nr:unnamed protein product [Linum tenue]
MKRRQWLLLRGIDRGRKHADFGYLRQRGHLAVERLSALNLEEEGVIPDEYF